MTSPLAGACRALPLAVLLAPAALAQVLDPTDPPGAVGSANVTLGVECARIPLCPNSVTLNGEAYAGNDLLWRTVFSSDTIELVDLANDCAVVASCPAPGGVAPSENTLLGDVLYHYDFGTGLLYAIDTTTCAVLGSCNPPGDDSAEGLTNDGTFLWKGDSSALYKIDPATCQVVASCPNPPGDSADGLSMCGEYLIMLGYSGIVYQIDPTTCQVVSQCTLNLGAQGNGIASDRFGRLFADQPSNMDVVDLKCDVEFGFPNFLDPTPCGPTNAITSAVGVPITFQVVARANTGAPGENVTITSTQLPPGASMNPPLPLQGQPAQSTFDWTPGPDQAGTYAIVFTATDQIGQAVTCEVTVRVELGLEHCDTTANSTGAPADVSATGTTSSSAGDLVLHAAPVPNDNGLFLHAMNPTQVPFGNGAQCVIDDLQRGAVMHATANAVSYPYDNSDAKHALGAYVGTTRHFQYWFRDPAAGGAYFNLSNAIAIVIAP